MADGHWKRRFDRVSTTKPVLLFAFANDWRENGRYLRNLAEEFREIRLALDRSVEGGLCSLVDLPNATQEEVFEKLLDARTGDRLVVFHFAGHSGGAEILLETSDGRPSPVYAGGMAHLLGQLPALQLVFLNGCATEAQAAELLAACVPAVIVTSQEIDDVVAAELAKRFYQALAGGHSIRESFKRATATVRGRFGSSKRDLYSRSFVPDAGEELDWPWKLYPDSVSTSDPADPTRATLTGDRIEALPMHRHIVHPETLSSELFVRSNLFDKLLAFARERDIVFALGGAGSGLKTFTKQFLGYLDDSGLILVESPDLEPEHYEQIENVREAAEKIRGSKVHFELKCLLTTLAYEVYSSLRDRFPDEIEKGLGGLHFTDALSFSDYYFASAKSEAMHKADPVPILRHFFETVQRFAEIASVEEVLVLMPWTRLAKCFRDNADSKRKNLGKALWKALGDFVTNPTRRVQMSYSKAPPALPTLDIYNKVCLIVCCSEVPYAHARKQRNLVARCIWPIPPLDENEVRELIVRTMPGTEDGPAAAEIMAWTGGAPWFVKLLLSYIRYNSRRIFLYENDLRKLIATCGRAAMDALEGRVYELPKAIGDFIHLRQQAVREALGASQSADDSLIEQRWAGPLHRVKDGYQIRSYRLEAFVASGLIWLEGDPWDDKSDDYVFRRYPTVYLTRACELPLAMYRSVTGNDVRLIGY
jgi:hypothetical protein